MTCSPHNNPNYFRDRVVRETRDEKTISTTCAVCGRWIGNRIEKLNKGSRKRATTK